MGQGAAQVTAETEAIMLAGWRITMSAHPEPPFGTLRTPSCP